MPGDGSGSQTVPWAKDIVVRLFHCLQRYPFAPDVRTRAVEHVRRRCLQLITADDFKELGKELSDIIQPVKLIDVLQATCGTGVNGSQEATDTPRSTSTANKHHPHKRRRQSDTVSDVAAAGAVGQADPSVHSGRHHTGQLIKPEPVRILPPDPGTSHDVNTHPHPFSGLYSSGGGHGDDVVNCLLHLVESIRLTPDQVQSLIRGLEGYLQQSFPHLGSNLATASRQPAANGNAGSAGTQQNANGTAQMDNRNTDFTALGGNGEAGNEMQAVANSGRQTVTRLAGIDSSTLESTSNAQQGGGAGMNSQEATTAAHASSQPSSFSHPSPWNVNFIPPSNVNETWRDPHTHNPHPPGSQPLIPPLSLDSVLHASLQTIGFSSPSTPVSLSQPSLHPSTPLATHLTAQHQQTSHPHSSAPTSLSVPMHNPSLLEASSSHSFLGANPVLPSSLLTSQALMSQWPLLSSWPQTLRNHFTSPLLLAAANAASQQAAQTPPSNN